VSPPRSTPDDKRPPQAAATEDAISLQQLRQERDELKRELESVRTELESQLRTQADELDTLFEERRLLQQELAVKDEYIASLREIDGRIVAVGAVEPAARYRVVDAINNQLLRVRPLHNALRWVARKTLSRGGSAA
jgi:hypothetical protein